jgi:hypothetical protein
MKDHLLFEGTSIEKSWEKEWRGMPEFIQKKERPYSTITVRFETKEDMDEFSRLINQKLTNRTKSIWYPFRSHWGNSKKRWIDEP